MSGDKICLTQKMANMGQFALGIASLIALWQASGIIERVLEVRKAVIE